MGESQETTIKHIVISGGGTFGLSAYGALKRLHEYGVWNIDNIVSIYGTSVGAIIGTLISLKYDWETTDNYIIRRPWENAFKVNLNVLLNSYENRGVFDRRAFESLLEPLFSGLDIPMDISMGDFFEITKIDLHIIVTELYDFHMVDISHKTHPNWILMDAIYASACLPVLFSPFLKDAKCYADGGFLCNYPLKNCIESLGPNGNTDEILALRRKPSDDKHTKITDETNLSDYLIFAISRFIYFKKPKSDITVKNEISIDCEITSLYNIYMFSVSQKAREGFIATGYDCPELKHYSKRGNHLIIENATTDPSTS